MAFVTNFSMWQLPLYQEAVRTWPKAKDFTVSKRDNRKLEGSGSLHYFGGEELDPFWRHFDQFRERFDVERRVLYETFMTLKFFRNNSQPSIDANPSTRCVFDLADQCISSMDKHLDGIANNRDVIGVMTEALQYINIFIDDGIEVPAGKAEAIQRAKDYVANNPATKG